MGTGHARICANFIGAGILIPIHYKRWNQQIKKRSMLFFPGVPRQQDEGYKYADEQ